jgi:hypothetical protein
MPGGQNGAAAFRRMLPARPDANRKMCPSLFEVMSNGLTCRSDENK